MAGEGVFLDQGIVDGMRLIRNAMVEPEMKNQESGQVHQEAQACGFRDLQVHDADAQPAARAVHFVANAGKKHDNEQRESEQQQQRPTCHEVIVQPKRPAVLVTNIEWHGERAMRQRNRLLEDGSRDQALFEGLENIMAEAGVAIAAARCDAVAALNAVWQRRHQRRPDSPFPWATAVLEGALEERIAAGLAAVARVPTPMFTSPSPSGKTQPYPESSSSCVPRNSRWEEIHGSSLRSEAMYPRAATPYAVSRCHSRPSTRPSWVSRS